LQETTIIKGVFLPVSVHQLTTETFVHVNVNINSAFGFEQ